MYRALTNSVVNAPTINPYEFFEDRPTQFAGIGSFAIKPIPAGTRILCEPPLFVLPDDADILQIYRAVTSRPIEDQMPFWALSQNVTKFKETDWIATLRANYSGKPSLPLCFLALSQKRALL